MQCYGIRSFFHVYENPAEERIVQGDVLFGTDRQDFKGSLILILYLSSLQHLRLFIDGILFVLRFNTPVTNFSVMS